MCHVVDLWVEFFNSKVDELSIDEAEANICVDAKELFEGASGTRLNGLYTKTETNQSPGIIKR